MRPSEGVRSHLVVWRDLIGIGIDNTIVCWGNNYYGRADAPSGTFTHVSAGESHSCGIGTDNTVTCWGDSRYGRADAPSGAFTHVEAGDWHSCGIRTDQTINCWTKPKQHPKGVTWQPQT